jgi:hypothetical protein
MRGATDCAKRLKQLFSSLRSRLGKVNLPPATDPITQLILGVLSRDTPETKASEGLERLRSMVVDYNELRVIPPIELAVIFADFPDARLKCEDISRALNGVFAQEHSISLDRLAGLPRRDVQELLAELDGLEPYTRARIRLLGLQQHAVPLDEAMWALARAEHVVDARCPLLEAQQFFERQIAEQDALEFYALLKRHAWNELGAAVKRREVERILSVPPDRTTRNMLQMISAIPTDLPGDDELAEELTAPASSASKPAAPATRVKHSAPRPAKASAPTKPDGRVRTAAQGTPPRKARAARKSNLPPAKRAAAAPPSRAPTSPRRAKRSSAARSAGRAAPESKRSAKASNRAESA